MNADLPRLPSRDGKGHKGTFGTVAVVGGCALRTTEEGNAGVHMIGGPALCAMAALRSGVGLVRLVMPEPILDIGIGLAPSATGVPLPVDHEGMVVSFKAAVVLDQVMADASCVAIGPGLGAGDGPRACVMRVVSQDAVPAVIDADAINALAEMPEVQRDFRAGAVLTPHPGEFKRLATALGMDGDAVDPARRPLACEMLAQRLGCVVVLKGAGSVVSDGHRTWVHTGVGSVNPALATAGTGDVLTGVIAGLIAQHYKAPMVAGERTVTSERLGGLSLFDCARLGVAAHAAAGQRWKAETGASAGLLAEDLVRVLPWALEDMRDPHGR